MIYYGNNGRNNNRPQINGAQNKEVLYRMVKKE